MNATVALSVPWKVSVLLTVNVLFDATVNVDPTVVVIARPFRVVAVAAPKIGLVNVGDVSSLLVRV